MCYPDGERIADLSAEDTARGCTCNDSAAAHFDIIPATATVRLSETSHSHEPHWSDCHTGDCHTSGSATSISEVYLLSQWAYNTCTGLVQITCAFGGVITVAKDICVRCVSLTTHMHILHECSPLEASHKPRQGHQEGSRSNQTWQQY